MPVLIRCLSVLVTLSWPFCVWLSISHLEHRWLISLLVLLLLLRLMTLRGEKSFLKGTALLISVTGIALAGTSLLLRDNQWLLWYPVAVNGIMLLLFGSSLFYGMPLVERFARLTEQNLPPQAIAYTYRVTQIWCLFFIVNGSIAALTCVVSNVHWWMLWNGMISYLLIGILMGGEWIVRQHLRKQA